MDTASDRHTVGIKGCQPSRHYEFNLSCCDPQSGKVYVPKGRSSATLELADGSVIGGPSQGDVIQALNGLSSEDWYVILEVRPGWFIQVGFDMAAGVPDGSYALEFPEKDDGEHFRVVVREFPRVVDTFQGSCQGIRPGGLDFSSSVFRIEKSPDDQAILQSR